MYVILYHICSAIFVAHYHPVKDENDSQLDVLGEESKGTPQRISGILQK